MVCSAHHFALPEVTVTTALPAEPVMAALPSLSLPEASGSGETSLQRGVARPERVAAGAGVTSSTLGLFWPRLMSSEPQKATKERKLFQGPDVTAVIKVALLIFEHILMML